MLKLSFAIFAMFLALSVKAEICPEGTFWAYPNDCNWYYFCFGQKVGSASCGDGLYFDPVTIQCVPPSPEICQSPGAPQFCPKTTLSFKEHPDCCDEYFICINGCCDHQMKCAFGLHWDQQKNECNFPINVQCSKKY